MRKLYISVLAAILASCLGASIAAGQTQFGTITGLVSDPSGAVIPDAQITLTGVTTGVERRGRTNASGLFTFANVPAADYDISVQQQGFRTMTQRVTVAVAQRLDLNFTLEIGEVTQTVTVTEAPGERINTATGELSSTVTPTQVADLPLLTRNPYNLVGLAPGASDTGSVTGDTRGLGYSVNGARTSAINFMLDGGENNDTFVAGVGQTVPLDAVQELRVQTNSMTAEFGRNAVVVNAITKSGSNSYHGSAWEYYRGAGLSAGTFEDNASGIPKSNFVRNQFGFSAGGPIVKDKTFFFGSLEGLRIRSSGTAYYYVPTQAFYDASSSYTRDFLDAFGGVPSANSSDCIDAAYLTDLDGVSQLTDVNTSLAIPADTNLFCRTSLKAPIDAGAGAQQNNWNFTGRIDHHFTDNTTLMGRYAFSQIRYPDGYVSLSPYNGFNTGEDDRNQNLNLTLTHSFTPNFYSETRGVYNRIFALQPLGEASSNTPCWQYDLAFYTPTGDGITFPGYVPDVCYFAGIPFGGPQNIYQGYQGFTWMHGKHTFKWGGQLIHMRDNRSFGAFENAYWDTFTMQGMLDGQIDFMYAAIDPKGKVAGDTYDVATDGPFVPPSFTRHFHYNEVAWYFEDSMKLTSRFTLTAGMRWEYFGVLHSPNNEKYLDANLFLNAVGLPDVNKSIYEQVRDARFSRTNHIYRSDYNNFAPRIGFAYDITGHGRTVLRGGYGIFYDRNFGNALFNVIQNPPNYMVLSYEPDAGYDPTSPYYGQVPILPNQFDTLATLAGASTALSSSARMMNPDMDTSYSPQWNLTLEHDFTGNGVIGSASYVGANGLKLYSLNNLNQRGSCLLAPDINPGGCNAAGGNSSRLNQTGLTGMNRRGNEGLSRYNGLELSLRAPRMGSTGLGTAIAYTWSHSIDNESSFFADSPFEANFGFGFRNGFFFGPDRASSTNDIRHKFSFAWDWQIPAARNMTGIGGQVLGGWVVSGIFSAQTGGAFSVYDNVAGSQCYSDGTNFCYPLLVGSVPSITDTPVPDVPNSFSLYDISSTFQSQADYCAGDRACTADLNILHSDLLSPRNLFRTPGIYNWDVALLKDFKLPREGMKLRFRSEFFNILNHSNLYAIPYTNGYTGAGSAVTGARGEPAGGGYERRNIQLALHLVW